MKHPRKQHNQAIRRAKSGYEKELMEKIEKGTGRQLTRVGNQFVLGKPIEKEAEKQ